jgi:GDP-D-mannose 3', 5'-epimerase
MKKIFVTGVAGMIGSNLAYNLVKTGFEVVGIDNLWRGKKTNLDKELFKSSNFEFRHIDIAFDRSWWIDVDSKSIIIHVADIVAGIDYVFSNEWSIFKKNIEINSAIAELISIKKPERLVYLGTACSYPQSMQRSISNSGLSENDKFPADPESGYGWSKLIGEIEFKLAIKDIKTKLITLDLHNVYGWPSIYFDNTSQVIPALIHKALSSEDKKLLVWGDGAQGRAFIHVKDAVSAIIKSISYKGDYSNFMIGPDTCTTISEIAELIISHPLVLVNEIVYDKSKPIGDIGRFSDSMLAKQELNWEISINLKDGISDLVSNMISDLKSY